MNGQEKIFIDSLETTVIEIVKKAAELANSADFDVTQKADPSNIVTSSDIAVQHFLHEKLKALIPSSGFFCEEEDLKDTSSRFIWVIDPIDGTMNYARGIEECAISVGLLRDQTPILGVVCDIRKGDVFSAALDRGARLNGSPIKVSEKDFRSSLFCTAMSLYKKEHAKVCSDIIYDVYMQCNDVRRFGSCALELCYLAAGRCDIYFEIRVFPWDFAAAALILSEAGGVISGFGGDAVQFNSPTAIIAANNNENHAMLNSIISGHMNSLPYKE